MFDNKELEAAHVNLIDKFDELVEVVRQARYYAFTAQYERSKDTLEKLTLNDKDGEDSLSSLRNLMSDLQMEEAIEFNRSSN